MVTLYTEDQIQDAITRLAPKIVEEMGPSFTVVPILTGGFIFAADLCRALYKAGADPEIDFLQLSSYGNARESSGNIRIVKDLTAPVQGQSVLIIDDVLDTGRSVYFAEKLLLGRGASVVKTCVAVNKRKERAEPVAADYALFDTDGSAFLVGYGMDDAGVCRAMPEIGVID